MVRVAETYNSTPENIDKLYRLNFESRKKINIFNILLLERKFRALLGQNVVAIFFEEDWIYLSQRTSD